MGIEAGVLAAYAAVAAAAVGAGAAIYQGQQQKATAETNAELTRRQAAADQDAAVAQAEKIRRAGKAQQAEANAALAASGVSVGEGTAVRIGREIATNTEKDAMQTILSGARRAVSGEAEAGMLRSQGSAASTAGYLNAGSSLLAGASAYARSGWKSQAQPAGG